MKFAARCQWKYNETVWYSEGVCGFLEIPKIQKFDRPKIQRFHADPKLLENPKD